MLEWIHLPQGRPAAGTCQSATYCDTSADCPATSDGCRRNNCLVGCLGTCLSCCHGQIMGIIIVLLSARAAGAARRSSVGCRQKCCTCLLRYELVAGVRLACGRHMIRGLDLSSPSCRAKTAIPARRTPRVGRICIAGQATSVQIGWCVFFFSCFRRFDCRAKGRSCIVRAIQ